MRTSQPQLDPFADETDPVKLRQHQQRTLLNQIIGYSDLLIREVKEWGRHGLATDLHKIRAAGQKLLLFNVADGASTAAVRKWAADTEVRTDISVQPVPPGVLLVVDDDVDNCELLARRLKQDGHTVHTALSGPEALALVGKQPIDLILLDMMMPGMDGQEVLGRLKQDPAQRRIPVLMFSAVDDLESVVHCIELGAEDYLPKPCPPVLMQARIGASLSRKRLLEEEQRIQSAMKGEAGQDEDAAEPEPGPAADGAAATPQRQSSQGLRIDLNTQTLLKIFGTIAAVWLLSKVWSVVILIAIALMLVATISPIVKRAESRIHRNWGITLVAVAGVGISAALLGILIPMLVRQAQRLIVQFPNYAQAIEDVLKRWHVPISIASLTHGINGSAAPQIIDVAGTVVGGVAEVIMVAVLSIYLLIDGPAAQLSLIRLFPRSERRAVQELLGTLTERVGSYMRGQILTSLLVGVFSFLLLLLCRVPEPGALSLWVAVTDAMPLVGLFVGMIPAVLMALTLGPTKAIIVAVSYIIYHQIESTVLIPRLYSKSMKLSGSVILISILAGGQLMGVVGALLALPVAAAVPLILRYIGQWRDRQTDRRRLVARQATS